MSSKVWWVDLPNEQIMESAWERQMNLSGIDAYERVKYDAKDKTQAASDSRAGQKLLRRLIDRATEAIAEAQKGLLKLTKVDRSLRATAMLLPPETAALIVLKRLIDSTYSPTFPK